MKDTFENILVVFITGIVVAIFSPVLVFAFSYFSGWILKVCIGNLVANSLNILFNTTRFTPEVIPMVCGALGTIGSFFKRLRALVRIDEM